MTKAIEKAMIDKDIRRREDLAVMIDMPLSTFNLHAKWTLDSAANGSNLSGSEHEPGRCRDRIRGKSDDDRSKEYLPIWWPKPLCRAVG